LTLKTEQPADPEAVWVIVDGVNLPRREWFYLLTEDEPGTINYGTVGRRPIPTDKFCRSYAELAEWLSTYGFIPTARDFFSPTPDEIHKAVESIVRRVTRPH